MLHGIELEFIRWIQQMRTPLLDQFFTLLDFFDNQTFFFVLIPTIWLWYGWKYGLRLYYIMLMSGLLNHALKAFFGSPRPFHIDPDVGLMQISGLGFPSGAAQTVMILSGLLLMYWKSGWRWVVAPVYCLFVSFARVYLGIHFPTDILGGWLVGLGLLAVYVYVRPPVERFLERLQLRSLFVLSQAVPILLLAVQHSKIAVLSCAIAMGMGVGLLVIHLRKFALPFPRSVKQYALSAAMGVTGTFLCYELTAWFPQSGSMLHLFARFLILGLWISLGAPLICRNSRIL